ncbi:MAG TPA: hypothetical protein VHO84_10955 [Syntrophorhabdaceae bacterium]|nr:hypothetical protein [Syntrophorhabdaceae bacterium]
MSKDHPGLDLTSVNRKLPYDIALMLPDSFSNFLVRSQSDIVNINYVFEYHLGNDFQETLPEFFINRFRNTSLINAADNWSRFDYVFVPEVSKSWLSTRIYFRGAYPVYSLQVSLDLAVYKSGVPYVSTNIRESLEKSAPIACRACSGENVLDQQQIRNDYAALLSKVYSKLDAYISDTFKEALNEK